MTDSFQWQVLFSMFATQTPIFIVSVLGCVVIVARWDEGGHASFWALMGFGLSAILCIVAPIAQTFTQQWAIEGGRSMAQRATALTALSIVWSILRAVSYAMLLMAFCVRQPDNVKEEVGVTK